MAKLVLNIIADGVATIHQPSWGFYEAATWLHLMTSSFAAGLFGVQTVAATDFYPCPYLSSLFSCFFKLKKVFQGDQCGCGCVGPEESNLTNSRQLETISNCVDFCCFNICRATDEPLILWTIHNPDFFNEREEILGQETEGWKAALKSLVCRYQNRQFQTF